MSTSDEQHAPDGTPADAVEPENVEAALTARDDESTATDEAADRIGDATAAVEGAGAASATEPAEEAPDAPVQVADEVPAPTVGAGPVEGVEPLAVADEKPAAERLGAEEPSAGTQAPLSPAPGAPTAPTAATPAGTAAWRPPSPTPVLGTAQPVRPPQPAPAPADEEATARHAAIRPVPVPPEPATAHTPPAPSGLPHRVPAAGAGVGLAGTAAAAAAGAAAGAAAATGGTAASTAGGTAATTVLDTGGAAATGAAAGAAAGAASKAASTTPAALADTSPSSSDLFPDPNAPRTITVGTHVLGVVVGILLPLASALVTVLGISRILAVEVDGWAAKVDVLGIVLVTLGVLLLLACALLSLWTPSVGLVGGAILTALGGFALYAPGLTRTGVLDVLTSEGWQPTVVQSVVVATSGTLVAIGVLLLGSGIVSSAARRHGIHLGAFRERHRTA